MDVDSPGAGGEWVVSLILGGRIEWVSLVLPGAGGEWVSLILGGRIEWVSLVCWPFVAHLLAD